MTLHFDHINLNYLRLITKIWSEIDLSRWTFIPICPRCPIMVFVGFCLCFPSDHNLHPHSQYGWEHHHLILSTVPSYPLFNFSKSLPELHNWIVKDGSTFSPEPEIGRWPADYQPPVSPGNDFITDWTATQSPGPDQPTINYRGSIWNSWVRLITAGSCVGKICSEEPKTIFSLGKPNLAESIFLPQLTFFLKILSKWTLLVRFVFNAMVRNSNFS